MTIRPTSHILHGAILATVLFAAGSAHAQATPYTLGTTVPESLTFTAADGKVHTFGELRGKPVVLEWTNPGCPFVQKHYSGSNMQKLQAEETAKGAVWITVNSGASGKQGYLDPQTAAQEVKKLGYNSSYVVPDSKGTLGKAFGAETTPHMFVLDKAGKLVYMGAIDSIPSFDSADVAKADNYVRAALTELAAGKAVSTPQTKSYGCSVKY